MPSLLDVNVLIALLDIDHITQSRDGVVQPQRPRRLGIVPTYPKRLRSDHVASSLSKPGFRCSRDGAFA